MITTSTRLKIKKYLECFIDKKIKKSKSSEGKLKPFHEALLSDEVLSVSRFERSFSTTLGTTFEECAKLIAQDNHKHAERGYKVEGHISANAAECIDDIISEIDSGEVKEHYPDMVEKAIEAARTGEMSKPRSCVADLRVITNDDVEILIEVKSPKPNKSQCLEATRKLLMMYCLKHSKYPNIKSYFATAYNPYGLEKSTYEHNVVLSYMDIDHQVLIGSEFWDLIGGKGTYQEILEIYQDIGREKGAGLLSSLTAAKAVEELRED